MAEFSFSLLFLLLAQFLKTLSQRNTSIEPNCLTTRDITRVKISDYISLFENCTTMVFVQDKFCWGTDSSTKGPIILLLFDTTISLVTGEMLQKQLSIARRRNPSQHCWATITILPETAGSSQRVKDFSFMNLPAFIDNTWRSHYFILITRFINEWPFLPLYDFNNIGLTELILVDVTIENISLLRFQYYNIYHKRNPGISRMHNREALYNMSCKPPDCFNQVVQLGVNISRQGKYFWTMEGTRYLSKAILFDLVDKISVHSSLYSRHAYQHIAEVTSFNQFLAILILQDVFTHGFSVKTPYHYLNHMLQLQRFRSRGFGFVMFDVEKYSFVSCHGVGQNSGMLDSLSSPFDRTIWISMCVAFFAVVLIIIAVHGGYISDALLFVWGTSFENAVSLSFLETRFRLKGYGILGIYTVVIVWSILVGTITTNWYKTLFTMEMIVPMVYKSPWTVLMDVEGIRILLPFSFVLGSALDRKPHDYFRFKYFYLGILRHCQRMRDSHTENNYNDRKTAIDLIKRLAPHFWINGTFSRQGDVNDPPYDKSALRDYPIQPIEYNELDSYGVVKNLKTCDKVALMDTKENIEAITNFLNDQQHQVRYVKGDGDSYFTDRRSKYRGWAIPPTRSSYVEERLKTFTSSGIMSHWKSVYYMWKPRKLLGYYANWTGPIGEAISQLDFSSKVTTGFYVYGIGATISTLVMLVEIVKHKHYLKYIFCLDYLEANFEKVISKLSRYVQ
ncbi:hypothetical protein Fcan01_21972 [Folsomia candida]|uniref:Uncharacterized protein n=1 Tax=Folsomia candida TaxID=158441 RepID=A0A226DEJ5_FOLCA|nr:hypothetical protein Fcan01_21972 [Folsomia candida]